MQITENQNDNPPVGLFRRIWNYRKFFIIEPLVLFWILPSCFNIIGIQNLGLEKACRVNLGLSKSICENMLDKSLNSIECTEYEEDADKIIDNSNLMNIMNTDLGNMILKSTDIANISDAMINSTSFDLRNITAKSVDLNYTVCKAERDTQLLVTAINGIRGPIAAIFPVIVILFAGGWSDRTGLRKPCMLFPMIGEALAAVALLITSIFMEKIPMEFGNILEKVLPAMLGGQTLMVMGIYSYLTATTAEADRTFRFGIFAMFTSVVTIIGIPFSGILYNNLGYVKLFIIYLCLIIVGILYLIFFVDEIPLSAQSEKNENQNENTQQSEEAAPNGGKSNLAFEPTEDENNIENESSSVATKNNVQSESSYENIPLENIVVVEPRSSHPETNTENESVKKRNCLVTFFDLTLAYDCIRIFLQERPNKGRTYLIILVIAYAIFLGPSLGEIDYLYQFSLIGLNWQGNQYSYHNTYSTAIVLVGTFLLTSVFSKAFQMTDPMVGLIASICTVISRPMFAFSKESILFYAATTIDMFVSTKAIAIKAIISTFVLSEELGRLYSILGITDAIGGFIFPPIYSEIYSSTLNSFPGAFFLFGEIFFIPNAILFGVLYVYFRKKKSTETEEEPKDELAENNIDTEGNNNDNADKEN